MNTETRRKLLIRAPWLFLVLVVGSTSFMWIFKLGAKEGKKELMSQLNQPGLSIMYSSRDDTHLVLIQQSLPMGNKQEDSVQIDVSAIDGLKAEVLISSGSSRSNSWEVVSLWRISNSSESDLPLTVTEFTNLPDGYEAPNNFERVYYIPPNTNS